MSIKVNWRTAKQLSGTVVIVWSAAVGAYVVVEGYRTWKDPANTKRDMAPSVAFMSTSTDTGITYDITMATLPDTMLDRLIGLPAPQPPGIFQRDT